MAESKIDALTKKRDQLNAQIQAIKSKEQAQKRKDDTRRKVLAGSVVMKLVKEDKIKQSMFNQWMNEELKKEKDRALFDLSPLAQSALSPTSEA